MKLKNIPSKLGVTGLALASGLTVSQMQAHQDSGTPYFKTGAYLGVQGGWSKMQVKINSNVDSDPGFVAPSTENKSNTDSRVMIDGLVGTRYLFNNGFMPAIEFVASFSEHAMETRFSHGALFAPPLIKQLRVDISRKNTLISSAVLGWVVAKKFYIFGKLGLGISQFKTTVTDPNPDAETFTQTKTKYGFVPALGLEYAVTSSFSAIASISYEYYGKVTHSVTGLEAPLPPVVDAATNQYKPSIISGKIGVIFKI